MLLLNNLPLNRKLFLIILTALCGMIAICTLILPNYYDDIIKLRTRKTKDLVETAFSLVEFHHNESKKKNMTDEEAKIKTLAILHDLKYSDQGYFWVNDDKLTMLMHPFKPELVGTNLENYKDVTGKLLFVEILKIVNDKGEGFITYKRAKLNDSSGKLYDKTSYIKYYAPWGWIIGSGNYQDDIETNFFKSLILILLLSSIIIIITIILTIIIGKNISDPIKRLAKQIIELAEQNSIKIIDHKRSDEVGAIGRSLNFFEEKLKYVRKLQSEKENEQITKENRQKIIETLIHKFKGETTEAVKIVDNSTHKLHEIANNMAFIISNTNEKAG